MVNLLWLDEALLRPRFLARADELMTAPLKPPLPPHLKTLYQCAKIKRSLSLNEVSTIFELVFQAFSFTCIQVTRVRIPAESGPLVWISEE